MISFSYEKSAQCCLRIKETSNAFISIDGVAGAKTIDGEAGAKMPKVVWALFDLSGAEGGMAVKGVDLNTPWSIVPLKITKSQLSVQGFSVPRESNRGPGPSNSGELLLKMYLWAVKDVDVVSLTTSGGTESVYFWFAGQQPLQVELKPESTTQVKLNGTGTGAARG